MKKNNTIPVFVVIGKEIIPEGAMNRYVIMGLVSDENNKDNYIRITYGFSSSSDPIADQLSFISVDDVVLIKAEKVETREVKMGIGTTVSCYGLTDGLYPRQRNIVQSVEIVGREGKRGDRHGESI